jgi:hypothetical protein
MLMAQSFDMGTLERIGPARAVAPTVGTTPSMGSPLMIGDFAAAANTLAYRAGRTPMVNLIAARAMGAPPAPAAPVQPAGEIIVLRNWM